jgi:hypothetical protein
VLTFLDTGHKFTLAAAAARPLIEFGNRLFFTTLAPGMPIQAMEQVLAVGGALFGSGLVFPALSFHAECVVLLAKQTSAQFPEQQLIGGFDFGFVQGLKSHDIDLEYWGQIAANGRSILHISVPGTFEVDTDVVMQPFTHISAGRFEIRNITQAASQFNSLRVSSDFVDHPMYTFLHTVQHTLANSLTVPHFIRAVSFKREFRTIFCVRDKKDGTFTAISSTDWVIEYNHHVDYSNHGATKTPVSTVSLRFPTGGNPSNINALDRQIMSMAKAGAPLLTPSLLQTRLGPTGTRTATKEDANPDFVPSFWS